MGLTSKLIWISQVSSFKFVSTLDALFHLFYRGTEWIFFNIEWIFLTYNFDSEIHLCDLKFHIKSQNKNLPDKLNWYVIFVTDSFRIIYTENMFRKLMNLLPANDRQGWLSLAKFPIFLFSYCLATLPTSCGGSRESVVMFGKNTVWNRECGGQFEFFFSDTAFLEYTFLKWKKQ